MPKTTKPRHADSFADLAERRAWLASLPNTRTRISTTPTRKRLAAANDNRRLDALDAVDALLAPHAPECLPDPAEPLDVAATGAGWRMRPTIGEIELAMAGRVAVRTAAGRTHAERMRGMTILHGGLGFTRQRRTERAPVLVLGNVVNGEVLVPAGAMVERGATAKGKALRPSEYRTFEKPDPEVKHQAALAGKRAIKSYLALRGTWDGYESWADRLGGAPRPMQRPESAAILEAAYANTPDLPPIQKLPTGHWWQGHWLGGVTRSSGLASGHDNHAQRAHDAAIRILVQKWLSERLEGDEARILALATSSATAEEAGAEVGMTRQRFVQAANDSLGKVSELLAA